MNKKVFMTVVIWMAVVLQGCSQSNPEQASEQEVISFDSQPVVITQETSKDNISETAKDNASEAAEDKAAETAKDDTSEAAEDKAAETAKDNASETANIIATVHVNVTYEDGSPDIIEYLDINGVKEKPDETGKTLTGYDESGKPVYKRSDSSVTDPKGAMDVEITYEFYSLDHDFDFRIEPFSPENGGGIETVKGSVITNRTSRDFTYETVCRRGQTGIWYAGICSCRNGVLGDYDGL